VVVTNLYGSLTTTVATLTVAIPPPLPPIVLQNVQVTNGTIEFTLNTVYGLNYQVQYTTDLTHPTWIMPPGTLNFSGYFTYTYSSGTGTITAGGSTLGISDPIRSDPKRFYRLRYAP
jgi:hypothetical protein